PRPCCCWRSPHLLLRELAFLKVDAVAVTSGGCSARSSAQRELVTSALYTTLADSTNCLQLSAPLWLTSALNVAIAASGPGTELLPLLLCSVKCRCDIYVSLLRCSYRIYIGRHRAWHVHPKHERSKLRLSTGSSGDT